MKLTFSSIVFVFSLAAQAPPVPLQSVIYSNIRSTSLLDGNGYIDNRSQFTRQSNYHAFRAYGTGTWQVEMFWADTNTSLTSYGSTAIVPVERYWLRHRPGNRIAPLPRLHQVGLHRQCDDPELLWDEERLVDAVSCWHFVPAHIGGIRQ